MENNKEKLEAMENTQANPSQQDAEISEEQLEAVAGGWRLKNGYDHCLTCGSTNLVVRRIPGPSFVPCPSGGLLKVKGGNGVYCADCGDLVQIDLFRDFD